MDMQSLHLELRQHDGHVFIVCTREGCPESYMNRIPSGDDVASDQFRGSQLNGAIKHSFNCKGK